MNYILTSCLFWLFCFTVGCTWTSDGGPLWRNFCRTWWTFHSDVIPLIIKNTFRKGELFNWYTCFFSRIQCDADGWVLQTNKDPSYPTYFHLFPPGQVQSLQLLGDMKVRCVKFCNVQIGEKVTAFLFQLCWIWKC